MADDAVHVRIKERLRIKIGEAKNLPGRHGSSEERDVFCTLSLDQEEIFRTATIEKTLNPLFGEEFQFEVPRDFRYISVYVFDNVKDRHLKQSKVLGKVAIKREDLTRYNNNKDYWFSIKPVDADSEVQGKVNIQLKFDTTPISNKSKFANCRGSSCLYVQVNECKDLTLKNGSCDAYAVVCVTYMNGKSVSKKTKVRKKTACPKFEEVFVFTNYEDNKSKDSYVVCPECELDISELRVSLWHYSGMGEDVFLGEVRIQLQGRQQQRTAPTNAWYFLQPRSAANRPRTQPSTPEGTRLSCENSLGSLRLLIQYNEDYVFPSKVYEPLKNLLLRSICTEPIRDSAVCILGEVISSQMEIAQPLVRIFMHHQQIVHIIRALAEAEISRVTDTTTLFRGNTLVTAMMEQAMRLIGLQYLHKTLRPTLELIFTERKQCEIDPAKVTDPATLANNLATLKFYVQNIFDAITQSAVHCPPLMCQIFHSLKECAITYFPGKQDIRYLVISGFIFLRFFAPAILGPKLFDLTTQYVDQDTNRTLTLISKTIQSLGNMICRSAQSVKKEEYMAELCNCFCTKAHIDMLSQFLEIISATSSPQTIKNDTPVTLKEGLMIKRAQGRKKFGLKNFKQRYFKLTTHDLSYSKRRDKAALCQIPLSNILAVERLEESSFKKKNMFQIVQEGRVLYIQAPNCVEQKEWVDLLTKICQTNTNRLMNYHPAAYVNGQWPCCKSPVQMAPGCQEVSKMSSNNFHTTIDAERELQRVHSLIFNHNDQLEAKLKRRMLRDLNYDQEISDQKAEVIRELRRISLEIEDRHRCYKRQLSRGTKYGSLAAPIGDDNYLLASRMNLNSSLLRRATSEAGGA